MAADAASTPPASALLKKVTKEREPTNNRVKIGRAREGRNDNSDDMTRKAEYDEKERKERESAEHEIDTISA